MAQAQYIVFGLLSNQKGSPLSGLLVQAVDQDPNSAGDLLGTTISNERGEYRITYTEEKFHTPHESGGADIVIKVFSPDGRLLKETERYGNAGKQQRIDVRDIDVPGEEETTTTSYTIKGQVLSESGEGIPGLIVALFNQGMPGKPKAEVAVGHPVITCADGSFEIQLPYQEVKDKCNKVQPDIILHVSDSTGAALYHQTHYAIGKEADIPVSLPREVYRGPSEFEKLNTAIGKHLDGLDIKAVQENKRVKGITYLAEKTKYNASLVEMTVLAHRYAAESERDIPEIFYYALLRAGARPEKAAFYRMRAEDAIIKFEKSVDENITPAAEKDREELKEAFRQESIAYILQSKPPRGMSTMDDMLSLTLDNETDKTDFVDQYYHGPRDKEIFWQQTSQWLGVTKAKQLRLNGQLGVLTFNNAELIKRLRQEGAVQDDPVELVRNGYYRKEAWVAIIHEEDIPDFVQGETEAEREEQFVAWLTGELRRAYPTQVVAERVKAGELPLTDQPAVRDQIYGALNQNEQGFKLGHYSINKHIAEVEEGGIALSEGAKKSLKRLHRAYQLAPNEETVDILLEKGLDSAFKITNYDQKAFVQRFASDFGGDEAIALQVYNKAVADAGLITNLSMAYLTQRNNPLPAAIAPMVRNSPEASVRKYPILENLFGSLDYCSCGHCESLLSPAAYYVELLEFIRKEEFTIPVFDEYGDETGATENVTAQQLLLDRRPDLEYLELTCDNTNNVLPYIDLVNEILEYYITSQDSIEGFTGYNMNSGVAVKELLASPQHVKEEAYEILKSQVYPLSAPFHRHLLLLREYFNKMNVPLYKAMEILRRSDHVNLNSPYGWRQIAMEQLGISPQEYSLFTDHQLDGVTAYTLQELYGLAPDYDLYESLANAKDFCRAVDIRYEELISILRTEFVNPAYVLIPKLQTLQASFNKAKEDSVSIRNDYGSYTLFDILYQISTGGIDSNQTDQLFPGSNGSAGFGGSIQQWVQDNYQEIGRIIFLTPKEANVDICQFDNFDLKYSDPVNPQLSDLEYWKLIRFIRLKNKLGLTFEATDMLIQALYNFNQYDFSEGNLYTFDNGWKDLLFRISLLFQMEGKLRLNRKKDFEKLLLFFGDINPHTQFYVLPFVTWMQEYPDVVQPATSVGSASVSTSAASTASGNGGASNSRVASTDSVPVEIELFNISFSRPSDLSPETTFQPNSRGRFLQDESQKLANHLPLIQGGVKLTDEGLRRIVERVPFYPTHTASNTTEVDFFDIPLSIPNVSILFRHSFLANALRISVEELLDLVELSGIDPFDNVYIVNNHYVEPNLLKFVNFVQRTKALGFKVQDLNYLFRHIDPTGKAGPTLEETMQLVDLINTSLSEIDKEYNTQATLTEEKIKAFFTLIYGSELTGIIYATLVNRPELTFIVENYTHPQESLEDEILAVDNRLAYNDLAHQLSFKGIMSETIRDDFKFVSDTILASTDSFKAAIDGLYIKGRGKLDEVFIPYPEIAELYELVNAGAADTIEARINIIRSQLEPFIRLLKVKVVEQLLSGQLKVSQLLVSQFLNTRLAGGDFVLHANKNDNEAALEDFLKINRHGFSMQYFDNTGTTTPVLVPQIDFGSDLLSLYESGTLPSNSPTGLIFEGYLRVPTTGYSNFYLETDAPGTAIELRINDEPTPMTEGNQAQIWENVNAIDLVAGQFYKFQLKITSVPDKAILKWQRMGTLKTLIPPAYCHPFHLIVNFSHTYVRLLKLIRLAEGLTLTSGEINYFAHRDAVAGITPFPNKFPVETIQQAEVDADLIKVFINMFEYIDLKNKLSIKDNSLVQLLAEPSAMDSDGVSILHRLTGWSEAELALLLTHFLNVTDLTDNIHGFRRLAEAFALIRQIGAPAEKLLTWTTNDPDAAITTDFHRMLKSKYDERVWLDVIQPINDRMRDRQRDALVSYVIKRLTRNPATAHIDSPDKLFEYFLIDVQMEPCMKTSRIKQAISSVQLYIDRCFMNLEALVPADTLNAKEWEWMKRYRVWEAARKLFLFPENWSDGSLRNTKSPFYKEFESELLQSDINDDLARTALLNYLEKLDEVAWLEVCGMCKEDEERIHVIGHTSGMNRKYYHRVYDGTWSPWEKIDLDLEGENIYPVWWKGRLFLFWPTIIQKGMEGNQIELVDPLKSSSDPTNITSNGKRLVEVNLNWSEYYNGKWQPKRTSDFEDPWRFEINRYFSAKSLRFFYYITVNGNLVLNFNGQSFYFYNKFSNPEKKPTDLLALSSARSFKARFINDGGTVYYLKDLNQSGTIELFDDSIDSIESKSIGTISSVNVVDIKHPIDIYNDPFFINDYKYVFFVDSKVYSYPINLINSFGMEAFSTVEASIQG